MGILALQQSEEPNRETDRPTQANAPAYTVWFVNEALDFYEANGLDATLERYNSTDSVDGPWYIFVTEGDGTVIGHYNNDLLGDTLTGPLGTDVTGYDFGAAMIAADENGRWVSYVFTNPATGEQQRKHSWVIKRDGYLFGSGWYEFTSYE